MQGTFTEQKLSKRLDAKKVQRMKYYVESLYFYFMCKWKFIYPLV